MNRRITNDAIADKRFSVRFVCWELKTRIEASPQLAQKILDGEKMTKANESESNEIELSAEEIDLIAGIAPLQGLPPAGTITDRPDRPQAFCLGCKREPGEIQEYIDAASPECYGGEGTTPENYVWEEEGTLNFENGHFLCTECYVKADCPSSPRGWVAP